MCFGRRRPVRTFSYPWPAYEIQFLSNRKCFNEIPKVFAKQTPMRLGSSSRAPISTRARKDFPLSERGDQEKSSLSPLTLDRALWIILTFGYVHFPILFEVVGFFLVAQHEATFSWELAPSGFWKLQAVQCMGGFHRRSRCDQRCCDWWRQMKCSWFIVYFARKDDNLIRSSERFRGMILQRGTLI